MMGGQECLKLAKERGVRCNWMGIRKGVRGQGRQVYDFWIASVVDRVEFAEVSSCCFDFRCASSYIMVGIVFLLVLGYIRDWC